MNLNPQETEETQTSANPNQESLQEDDPVAACGRWMARKATALIAGLISLAIAFVWAVYWLFEPLDAGLILVGTLEPLTKRYF